MAASGVLSRDPHCDVPRGYASFASLPAVSLDDHFEQRYGERSQVRLLNSPVTATTVES